MELTNKISNYSSEELDLLAVKLSRLLTNLKETDEVFGREIATPSKPLVPDDNVFHVDFSPMAEYKLLEKIPMPFHEIVDVYEKWNNVLSELVYANVGHFNNQKLVLMMMQVRQVVSTFQSIFDAAS